MALLTWRAQDGLTGQFQLTQSRMRVGRAAENEFVIPDPSVSSVHAEILFENGQITLQDLGSTNGTYVAGQRVQQALIAPGERFRLGSAELELVRENAAPAEKKGPSLSIRVEPSHDAPVRVNVPAAVAVEAIPGIPASAAGAVCFAHPVSAAAYTCTKCRRDVCTQCVKSEIVGGRAVNFCRHCGGKCVPHGQPGQPVVPVKPLQKTFGSLLPSVFTYPFRGNGLILLLTGTVFFGFLDLITSSPVMMFRGSGLIVKIIMYGYFFAYMQSIVNSSAQGEELPPSWPEVSDIHQDIFHPFWLFLGTLLASFLPGILLYISEPLPGMAVMLLGTFYFPMALLAVAMADSLSGLNPIIVFSAILKVPGSYLLAVFVCALLLLVRTWLPTVFDALGLPIIPRFLLAGCALFLIMIEMRILGLLYYTKREKFGWFRA